MESAGPRKGDWPDRRPELPHKRPLWRSVREICFNRACSRFVDEWRSGASVKVEFIMERRLAPVADVQEIIDDQDPVVDEPSSEEEVELSVEDINAQQQQQQQQQGDDSNTNGGDDSNTSQCKFCYQLSVSK